MTAWKANATGPALPHMLWAGIVVSSDGTAEVHAEEEPSARCPSLSRPPATSPCWVPVPLHHALLLGHRRGPQLREDEGPESRRSRGPEQVTVVDQLGRLTFTRDMAVLVTSPTAPTIARSGAVLADIARAFEAANGNGERVVPVSTADTAWMPRPVARACPLRARLVQARVCRVPHARLGRAGECLVAAINSRKAAVL
ncbi:MAG: hypothetical protein ACLUQH_10845 [Collinsella sp.]